MDEPASDFVTVVEVDEKRKNCDDFVTVVHIVPQEAGTSSPVTEDVQIFRVPGERLGMALKFEGGACASQPIDRVFIQNINKHSPASRARGKLLGPLQEGDELLRIQGRQVRQQTRISVVSSLRDERTSSQHRDTPLAVTLTVARHRAVRQEAKTCISRDHPLANGREVQNSPILSANHLNGRKGPPPPIPPRLSSTTLSTVAVKHVDEKQSNNNNKLTSFSSNGVATKANGKTVTKKSPPPLPPRRPKEPPPAAPTARKSLQNCKSLLTGDESTIKNESPLLSLISPVEEVSQTTSANNPPPVAPEVYTDTLSDKSVCLESESDDTGSSVSTVIERFSRASTASSSIPDFVAAHTNRVINIDHVLEPFEQLEREFDQKEALQKFVNETAAMLEESMQNDFTPNSASNLDDYDDIESLSMTLSAFEQSLPTRISEKDCANSLKEAKALKNHTKAGKSAPKTNAPAYAKKEVAVSRSKSESRPENQERNGLGKGIETRTSFAKPGARAKSPSPISKRRPGILKKPKDGSNNKANSSNSNSSLQRKIANKSATNSLKNSLPQNSRSTTNLCHFNSMIPKLDHQKHGPQTPMPRKCRSTSNLVTAVGLDWDNSKPSLIPRPVNKTVTFAENLVKQIQSPINPVEADDDGEDADHEPEVIEEVEAGEGIPATNGAVEEEKAIADLAAASDDGDVLEPERDAGGGVLHLEEKVAADEDVHDAGGGGSRDNDSQVDDKTDSIPLVVQDNSRPHERSDHCLNTSADSSDHPEAANSSESLISFGEQEEFKRQKVTESSEAPLVSHDTSASPTAPQTLSIRAEAGDLSEDLIQANPLACPDQVPEDSEKGKETEEMNARCRFGESLCSPADSSWKGQSSPVQTRPRDGFADQQAQHHRPERCGLLKKSNSQFHHSFKFLHEDSGIYCDAESPSPEFAKYDPGLTIAAGLTHRPVKQIPPLPSPDNDSGITSDSMDEYEIASSNSSSSRDGCRKYQFKESDLTEVGTQEEESQAKLLTDPLPPVRERIAHFQEQVRRSIEALSQSPSHSPAFASCFGQNSVSKSLSDVRNQPMRLSCNFSSTTNISNQQTLRSISLTSSQTSCPPSSSSARVEQTSSAAPASPLKHASAVSSSTYAGHLQPSYRRFTSYDALVGASSSVSPLSPGLRDAAASSGSANMLTGLLESRRQSTTKLKGLMIPDPSSNSSSSLSIDTKMPTIVSKSFSTDHLLLQQQERSEDMNRNNTITESRQAASSNRSSAVSASLLQSFAGIKSTVPKYTPAFKRRAQHLSGSCNSISSSSILSPSPSMALLNPMPFTLSQRSPPVVTSIKQDSPLVRSISHSGDERVHNDRADISGRESGSRVSHPQESDDEDSYALTSKGTPSQREWSKEQRVAGGEGNSSMRSSSDSCSHFRALAQKWEQRVIEERRSCPSASSSSSSGSKLPAPCKSLENLIRPATLTEDNLRSEQFSNVVPDGKNGKDDLSKCEGNVIKSEKFGGSCSQSHSKNGIQTKIPDNASHSGEETFSKISPTRNTHAAAPEKTSHDPLIKCQDSSMRNATAAAVVVDETDNLRSKCTRTSRAADLRGQHCRFSSVDSNASDSSTSTAAQILEHSSVVGSRASSLSNLRDSQYGSVTSLASSTSLISPQELQQLIDEANHSVKGETSHNIQVVVLNRDYKTIGSVGIILAGGIDCETREITIHKIISGSIADRDGRIRKGDRVLSINGRIIRSMTHKEALDILRAPRPEVVLVLSRPSLTFDSATDKAEESSRSPANSLSQVVDDNDAVNHQPAAAERTYKTITAILPKDGAGLGFILEGGKDSPLGDRPLIVKKMFKGGLADKEGSLMPGDEILFANNESVSGMTRTEAWAFLKKLPDGPVELVVRRVDYGF